MFDHYLLLMLVFLSGIVIGIVVGLRICKPRVKEGPAARTIKRASALDYDVIPMEGLKDE